MSIPTDNLFQLQEAKKKVGARNAPIKATMKDKKGSGGKSAADAGKKEAQAKAADDSKSSEVITKTEKELIEEETEKIYSEMAKDIEKKREREDLELRLMLLPSALPPWGF